MRSRCSQRGEGKIGFLVALIVVGAVVFAAAKFVPVYVAGYDLRDTIRREAQAGSLKTDSQILTTILDKCKELELPVGKEHVIARRTKSKLHLKVEFEVPIDMAIFTYQYKFSQEETAPLF